jgi:hypothetical protein
MIENPYSIELFYKRTENHTKRTDCIYRVEEILSEPSLNLDFVLMGVINALPSGLRFPEISRIMIKIFDSQFCSDNFEISNWSYSTPINIGHNEIGTISVYYLKELKTDPIENFSKGEISILDSVAGMIGDHLTFRVNDFNEYKPNTYDNKNFSYKSEWQVVLNLLKATDQHLFSIISRKMINYLFFKGIEESYNLFRRMGNIEDSESTKTEINRPSKKTILENSYILGEAVFNLCTNYLSDTEILSLLHKWINEERSNYLVKALSSQTTPLTEIIDAIRRYYRINPTVAEKSSPINKGIRVSLVRRFLTDQLEYINIAKSFCEVEHFYELIQRMIYPTESHGKVGGKSAGIFLAKRIIDKYSLDDPTLRGVKTPKTWYITSDGLINFIYYNNLDDITEQKYKEMDEIRQEYSHFIQAFKNSHFPQEIINGLSRALDDFGDNPIIVRSSSLLEDRMGSAFAGKYKSLFLANQGTKLERMEALMDAVAEVYASMFGPDPINYRIERGFIDFNEEMGVLIQEVVGKKVGKYFLPAFGGVAFSNNEFRWSPRIKREDGLIRIVPGLGTRAVDRISDDYPILIAPGQPELRVNQTYHDVVSYSPKNIDIINLETNTFESISLRKLISEVGNKYPLINDVFSIQEEGQLRRPIGIGIDTKKHEIVASFDNLIYKGKYVTQLNSILKILKEKLQTPVDIEFACDGENIYLLQCRPQSSSDESSSAIIPSDADPNRVIFTANKYVSNGNMPDLQYIVYVDSISYSKRENYDDLKDIGKAVGKLNKILPKKSFILMGPGRWGSRDDIRLGVSVTYSDINNTAMLVEIARKKESYVPDLSFGTHFFQDLVETSIRYLPLYPDDEGIVFNEDFFMNSKNSLTEFSPEYEHIADTLRVINVPEATNKLYLRILMNADGEEAMALLVDPTQKSGYSGASTQHHLEKKIEPWQWRQKMAELISEKFPYKKYQSKAMYLTGNTLTNNAGPKHDIDFILHFNGTAEQKKCVLSWFEGWNDALVEQNRELFGYKVEKMIDLQFISDKDIHNKNQNWDLIDPKKKSSKLLKSIE